MMGLAYYLVDAFTDHPFGGNPTAVCVLDVMREDAVLRGIAAESGLPVSAFVVDRGDAWAMRFLTPTEVEFPMVGHATLAAAHVVLSRLRPNVGKARFVNRDGLEIGVERRGDWLAMSLPIVPAGPCSEPATLGAALGRPYRELYATKDRYMAVFEDEDDVRALAPDMGALMQLDFDLIATAPGRRSDFVSRVFAPHEGLPEDPVCGSAHCTMVPFWSARLGRAELNALQVSSRGGELRCKALGEQVEIAGRCALVMTGMIEV